MGVVVVCLLMKLHKPQGVQRSACKRYLFGQPCEPSLLQKKKKSPSPYIQETNVLRCHVQHVNGFRLSSHVNRLSFKRRKIIFLVHSGDKCFAEARSVSKRFSFGQPCEPSLLQRKKNQLPSTFRRQMFCGATFCV